MTKDQIWGKTLSPICETILAHTWNVKDWEMTPEEDQILRRLNMHQGMVAPQMWKEPMTGYIGTKNFSRPMARFIKLNFDGASKGNPGPAGIGGLFRNDQGRTTWIYSDNGGIMRNNEAEYMAVNQGLKIEIKNIYNNLEVEGESQMVIHVIKRLNNGTSWDKVTKSWRTTSLIQDLEVILKIFEYMIIKHVRREANKVADFLVN